MLQEWKIPGITEKNLKGYDDNYYERYNELLYETNVSMSREVVILEMNEMGKKFSIQFGKIFSMKELHPASTRQMMRMATSSRVVMAFAVCI